MIDRRINHKDLRDFAAKLLTAAGTDAQEASTIAEVLVWADLAGRSTQGVWRLTVLLPRLRGGFVRSPCSPNFTRKTDAIVSVDGHDGFGQYVGHVAMARAIELARAGGMGVAAVRNSNHYSAGAYYAQLAAREGLIGFAFTNATRRVAPYGGLSPLFGTNPVSFGAPLPNGRSVLIDFSTGAMAGSVIRKATETNEPIPVGVAIDEHGGPVTDPKEAQRATLLPFGGAKGYCLSFLVEILTGVLTESLMSFQIPTMHEKIQSAARIGHFFLVIDIATLLPLEEYYKRMDMLVAAVRSSRPQTGVAEILIPGETRWCHYTAQLKDGVLLDSKTIASLKALAAELKVVTPW
jgi:LDH2 family malate/lactate/ureidoglycolate dehydrogenase